jgi:hypothetical protein
MLIIDSFITGPAVIREQHFRFKKGTGSDVLFPIYWKFWFLVVWSFSLAPTFHILHVTICTHTDHRRPESAAASSDPIVPVHHAVPVPVSVRRTVI